MRRYARPVPPVVRPLALAAVASVVFRPARTLLLAAAAALLPAVGRRVRPPAAGWAAAAGTLAEPRPPRLAFGAAAVRGGGACPDGDSLLSYEDRAMGKLHAITKQKVTNAPLDPVEEYSWRE